MTTTVNLKRILDRKQWEIVNSCPSGTATGAFAVASTLLDKWVYFFVSSTVIYAYDPAEDSWITLPSSAAGGTFGAGATGSFHSMRGQTDTATGGSTTTINTSITAARSMVGYKVRVVSGPGAGDERTIVSNTVGANSVFTVDSAFSATITASSVVQFITGSVYFWNSGTMSASSFRRYDVMTNTWSSLSVTSAPASWGTDGKMIVTRSTDATFAAGSATSGGATQLNDTSKTWTTSQWINFQVRIVSGTGAGQVRTISANGATQLEVSVAWATNPDATSAYVIEGNDRFLYLTGNGATTFYRYDISANTWSTLAARGTAPGTGMGAAWISGSPAAAWTNESAIVNGRRIYSFRGGGGGSVDYYDIPSNTWTNGLTYGPASETFTTGTSYADTDGCIYISKEATGRWFKFDCAKHTMYPWSLNWYAQSTAQLGDRGVVITYEDGATTLKWVLCPGNNQTFWHRCLIF